MFGLTKNDLRVMISYAVLFLIPYAICMSGEHPAGWFSWHCLAVGLTGVTGYHMKDYLEPKQNLTGVSK